MGENKSLIVLLVLLGIAALYYYAVIRSKKNGIIDDEVKVIDRKDKTNTKWLNERYIATEFSTIIKKLANNFGGVWVVANGETKNMVNTFENVSYVIQYSNNENLQKWWKDCVSNIQNWSISEYVEHAKMLIGIFEQCGVMHSNETTHIISSTTLNNYIIIDSEYSDGDNMNVIVPYWIYNDVVIEKGILTHNKRN